MCCLYRYTSLLLEEEPCWNLYVVAYNHESMPVPKLEGALYLIVMNVKLSKLCSASENILKSESAWSAKYSALGSATGICSMEAETAARKLLTSIVSLCRRTKEIISALDMRPQQYDATSVTYLHSQDESIIHNFACKSYNDSVLCVQMTNKTGTKLKHWYLSWTAVLISGRSIKCGSHELCFQLAKCTNTSVYSLPINLLSVFAVYKSVSLHTNLGQILNWSS